MNDTFFLRLRIKAAMAAVPLSAAALAVGCGDIDYYGPGEGIEQPTPNQPREPGPGENPTEPTPPGMTPTPTPQPVPEGCVQRNRGEFDVQYDDPCYTEGSWTLHRADAAALTEPPCDGDTDPFDVCPDFINLPRNPDGEGYRHRDLYLRLADIDGELCVYVWSFGDGCVEEGRALATDERNIVAVLRSGNTWSVRVSLDEAVEALSPELRTILGELWLVSGRYEHASIASFARATLELMAHAAPPELLAEAQQAALDEVKHAQESFALAQAYSGKPLEPGRLESPQARYGTLAELAVETFAEGAAGESAATLSCLRGLQGCEIPEVSRVLEMLVEEESRHAALAWRTLRWAVEQGGDEVRDALKAAAVELRPSADDTPPAFPEDLRTTLRRHGRLDPQAHHRASLDAWEGIVLPMLDEILEA